MEWPSTREKLQQEATLNQLLQVCRYFLPFEISPSFENCLGPPSIFGCWSGQSDCLHAQLLIFYEKVDPHTTFAIQVLAHATIKIPKNRVSLDLYEIEQSIRHIELWSWHELTMIDHNYNKLTLTITKPAAKLPQSVHLNNENQFLTNSNVLLGKNYTPGN